MLNSATYSLSPDLRYVMVVHDAKRVFRQSTWTFTLFNNICKNNSGFQFAVITANWKSVIRVKCIYKKCKNMGKTIIWSFQAFNDGQVHHSKFGRQVTTHLVFVFINFFPSLFFEIFCIFNCVHVFFTQVFFCCLYLSIFAVFFATLSCLSFVFATLHLKGWGRKSSVDWKSKVLPFHF